MSRMNQSKALHSRDSPAHTHAATRMNSFAPSIAAKPGTDQRERGNAGIYSKISRLGLLINSPRFSHYGHNAVDYMGEEGTGVGGRGGGGWGGGGQGH